MMEQKEVWDRAYRQKHPCWRGPSNLDLNNLKDTVLELGCGDGKTAIALVKAGSTVVGLDLSGTALLTSRRRVNSENLSLVQGDAVNLPFRERSFNCVTVVHFIDHFLSADRLKVVGEIDRVLGQGGIVIGRFFSIKDMRFGRGKQVEPHTFLRGNGIFSHYFEEGEILDLFAGYSVLSINSSMNPIKLSGNAGYRSFITVELRKSSLLGN
jgi:SAM-dependent methyltransferase